MPARIRLGAVSLDCAEPQALAAFYAELTGGEIAFTSADFVAVKGPGGWLTAQRIDDYRPPTWPAGAVAKQVHLDFAVDDLDDAQAAAVGLGARVAEEQPAPDQWRVLIDPAGHPFCLTTLIPEE